MSFHCSAVSPPPVKVFAPEGPPLACRVPPTLALRCGGGGFVAVLGFAGRGAPFRAFVVVVVVFLVWGCFPCWFLFLFRLLVCLLVLLMLFASLFFVVFRLAVFRRVFRLLWLRCVLRCAPVVLLLLFPLPCRCFVLLRPRCLLLLRGLRCSCLLRRFCLLWLRGFVLFRCACVFFLGLSALLCSWPCCGCVLLLLCCVLFRVACLFLFAVLLLLRWGFAGALFLCFWPGLLLLLFLCFRGFVLPVLCVLLFPRCLLVCRGSCLFVVVAGVVPPLVGARLLLLSLWCCASCRSGGLPRFF